MTSHVRGKYTEDKTDQQTLAATEKKRNGKRQTTTKQNKTREKERGKIYINDQVGRSDGGETVTVCSQFFNKNVPCQPFSLITYSPLGRVITKRAKR